MNAAADSAVPPSGPRIAPRLAPAWGGIWRLTWRRVFAPNRTLTVVLLAGFLGVLTYLFARHPDTAVYRNWVDGFVLTVLVPIMAFLSGAGAVRELLKPGAVDYLMTRPLPRPAYVLFQYLAQCVCGLIAGLALIGLLTAVGAFAGAGDPEREIARQVIVMSGGVAAFTALGFLCGALVSRPMILGLVYGGLIEAGLGNIPIQLNRLSILRHLRVQLAGSGHGSWQPTAETLGALALVAAISAGLVGLAMLTFTRREFLGTKGKEE